MATPTERKAEIVAELQALDVQHRDRALSPEAEQRWQELDRELETVEEQIGTEAVR
jgi:hypothetical protein